MPTQERKETVSTPASDARRCRDLALLAHRLGESSFAELTDLAPE
jgi:hypothetical protein